MKKNLQEAVSGTDPRTWADMDEALRAQGTSLDAVVESLKNGTPLPKAKKAPKAKVSNVTPRYVAQVVFLHRCKHFQLAGQYVDPRTFVTFTDVSPDDTWSSAEELDAACTREGL